ncbi:hypothetical protein ACP275_14G240600 [Erythranthe tilingii]
MKMSNKNKMMATICLLVLTATCTRAEVHVQVKNELKNGVRMNVHCRSRDDDLGLHAVDPGEAVKWDFMPNFWGTTLFYCDVQWSEDHSIWYHFDAYNDDRDYRRCHFTCRWMISGNGTLYGYDDVSGYWSWYPLIVIKS